MWKNRGVNQSADKLLSIAGIAAISLAMGWNNETKVDNLGERADHLCVHLMHIDVPAVCSHMLGCILFVSPTGMGLSASGAVCIALLALRHVSWMVALMPVQSSAAPYLQVLTAELLHLTAGSMLQVI